MTYPALFFGGRYEDLGSLSIQVIEQGSSKILGYDCFSLSKEHPQKSYSHATAKIKTKQNKSKTKQNKTKVKKKKSSFTRSSGPVWIPSAKNGE